MKLLFDQNLSHRLVPALVSLYPGSAHVRDLGLKADDDDTVWNYALKHGFTIVSKDADFRQRSFLFGSPPKVVWIRLTARPKTSRRSYGFATTVCWRSNRM